MDELLRDFLTETNESLDTVDEELVRFEQDPNNARILGNVFRLVHTIKGTCGFLGLPRLGALSHAAETLMGKFRDGMPVTGDAVTLVLASIDRIKEILGTLEATQHEPPGADADLIAALETMAVGAAVGPHHVVGSLVHQVLERTLRPGEVSLDELERAFRETAVEPETPAPPQRSVQSAAHEHPAGAAEAPGKRGIAAQSIRVHVDALEHLMTMVSELVLTRNQLLQIVRRHEESEFKVPLQRLSNVTAELQDGVMKTRMQPIGNAWQKLPRIVRDLAAELGKDIELQMLGADTELDRQVLELIKDPLTHMVRNCADHALETAEVRVANGKPAKGAIRLSAYHEGGHIIIEVADDGRGLNTEKIKAKAIDSGLISAADAEKMNETQIHKLIFVPGLSTAPAITNISGRGVGMDVVRNNIDQISGAIDVKSIPGEGCVFTVKIPLTLAIVSALIVESAGARFAIPQLAVVELVRIHPASEHRIERLGETPVLRLRDKLLPLVHLVALLRMDAPAGDFGETGFIVVTQVGGHKFGMVVDGVFHTEEIVVKPMSSKLRHIGMFSGNTILGDGQVILIVDPNGIAEAVGTARAAARLNAGTPAQEYESSVEAVSLLVFRAGSRELKAAPLSLVTRLEEIDCKTIEMANGRHLVQYRGHLMPLVFVNDGARPRTEGVQPVMVFSDAGRSMGLAVDEIVDIVETTLDIEVASETPGVLGSAIVKGRATEIIDVAHFLPLAFEDWFRRRDNPRRAAAARVMLIDDSAFFRNLIAPVLQAGGYEVTTCSDAPAALKLLGSGRGFDVILTDIEMPGMDGWQFAQAVRADPRLADVPMIALSSHAELGMLERMHAAGFREFVAKFDRPGLIAALKATTVAIPQAA